MPSVQARYCGGEQGFEKADGWPLAPIRYGGGRDAARPPPSNRELSRSVPKRTHASRCLVSLGGVPRLSSGRSTAGSQCQEGRGLFA